VSLERAISLCTAGFMAVLGFVHLFLPDLAYRWRVGRDPSDVTRPMVRLLGIALLVLAALVTTAALLILL